MSPRLTLPTTCMHKTKGEGNGKSSTVTRNRIQSSECTVAATAPLPPGDGERGRGTASSVPPTLLDPEVPPKLDSEFCQGP